MAEGMLAAGGLMAAGLGGLLAMVGGILAYVAVSWGTYLLAKKYAPQVHPAWSWIPIAQIYPLVAVSGQPLWWIAVIIIAAFIPVIGQIVAVV